MKTDHGALSLVLRVCRQSFRRELQVKSILRLVRGPNHQAELKNERASDPSSGTKPRRRPTVSYLTARTPLRLFQLERLDDHFSAFGVGFDPTEFVFPSHRVDPNLELLATLVCDFTSRCRHPRCKTHLRLPPHVHPLHRGSLIPTFAFSREFSITMVRIFVLP